MFSFCEAWLDCLARHDFHAASDLIVRDGHHQWTPELLERLISNYGRTEALRSGRKCAVTPPHLAMGVPSLSRLRIDDDPRFSLTIFGRIELFRQAIVGMYLQR